MTPAARYGAAVEVLDRILAGDPAEAALLRWSRASRFAGSGDRAAVRDLVFDSLRRRASRAALGGALTGRGLILGALREAGAEPASVFGAGPHAPAALTPEEAAAGRAPSEDEALNLPPWLIGPMREALGADLPAAAARLAERAPVWLRANALKASPAEAASALARDGIAVEAQPDLPQALRVTEGARRLKASRAYLEGLVELQDLAPQRAVALLGDVSGLETLDFCAGGGGKALALAAGGARVTAHDADPRRMADLPARAARAGARIAVLAPGARLPMADLVVADVPCSGSGTWARTPDQRWRLTPEALAALLVLQARILDTAAACVRPGGRLALMTCSLLTGENEGQAEGFLARHPTFTSAGSQRMSPLDGGDGFFAAIFQAAR